MRLSLPRSAAAWWGAFAYSGNRLLGLLLGIVLARSLGAEGYGVYAYAIAWLGVLLIFAQCGVPLLVMREVAAQRATGAAAAVAGILRRGQRIALVASLITAGVAASVLWILADALSGQRASTLLWMLVCLPFVALSETLIGAVRGLGRSVLGLNMQQLLRPFVVLMLVLCLVMNAVELLGPVSIMQVQLIAAVASCAIGLLLLRRLSVPAQPSAPRPRAEPEPWAGKLLPLTVISGATMLNSQIDMIILGFYVPAAEVGIYRVAVQVALLTAFGMQVASSVLAPVVAGLWSRSDVAGLAQLVRRARWFIALAAPAVAALLLLGGERLLALLFGPAFSAAYVPMVWLVAGQLVNAFTGPTGVVLNMCGFERRNSQLLLLSCGLNFLLNLLLIPLFGILGAAAATAFTLALRSIAQWFLVRRLVWQQQ